MPTIDSIRTKFEQGMPYNQVLANIASPVSAPAAITSTSASAAYVQAEVVALRADVIALRATVASLITTLQGSSNIG